MRHMPFLALSLAMVFLVSCQTSPTKVRETVESPDEPLSAEKVLEARPAVLDVRKALDFGVSHVPGAINVRWEDFAPAGARKKGLVDPDDFALARRLALWGIDPDRPVLIIGDGLKGQGEEAWVGWLFRYLGVKRVTLGVPSVYRGQIPRQQGAPENRPMWKPDPRTALLATPEQGLAFLTGPSVANPPWSRARSSALQGAELPSEPLIRRVVLDVRTPEERAKLPLKTSGWTGATVEIGWREFFLETMQPRREVLNQLRAARLDGTEEILVVSENGLESGAAAYALDVLHFGKPKNLTGGLRGLEARK